MSGFIYAAKIGNNVKIGWTENLENRRCGLRSRYKCAAEFIGVLPATRMQESKFHRRHKDSSVASEVYPAESAPVVEFMNVATPYVHKRNVGASGRRPKWDNKFPFSPSGEAA